jgi:hypothetical protein
MWELGQIGEEWERGMNEPRGLGVYIGGEV